MVNNYPVIIFSKEEIKLFVFKRAANFQITIRLFREKKKERTGNLFR